MYRLLVLGLFLIVSANCSKPEQVYLNIGLAYEGKDQLEFYDAFKIAKGRLEKYGINICLKESVEVVLPTDSTNKAISIEENAFAKDDFEFGVKYSFDEPHDYYFVWTKKDYALKDDDYVAHCFTEKRICLIDYFFFHEELPALITQEILRMYVGANNTTVHVFDSEYYTEISKEQVQFYFGKTFSEKPFDTTTNLNIPRNITVNIGLDQAGGLLALTLLEEISMMYSEDFNISLSSIGFTDCPLPVHWNLKKEMRKFQKAAISKSNHYYLFTNRYDGGRNKDEANSKPFGEAYVSYGCAWLRIDHNRDISLLTLAHEIGHLLGGKHVYRIDAVMHPHLGGFYWCAKNKELILQKKFREWGSIPKETFTELIYQ